MNARRPATSADAVAELAFRELARRHMYDALLWRRRDIIPNRFLARLMAEAEAWSDASARGEAPIVLCEGPPQHGKTEGVGRNLGPLHMARNPGQHVIYATSSQGRADDVSRDARRAASDYALLWPHMAAGDVANVQAWDTAAGSKWRALGVGVASAGITAHAAIVDDPFASRADASSRVARDRAWDWLRGDIIPRTTRTGGGVWVQHTRWHEDDAAGRMRREFGDRVRVLSWPAIAEVDEVVNGALWRRAGEALAPEIVTVDDLTKIRALIGARDWDSLYMQRPVVEDGESIRRVWFAHDRPGVWYTEPPDHHAKTAAEIVVSVDGASKQGTANDWTVVHAWAKVGRRAYLLDEQRGRWDSPTQIERVKGIVARWRAMGRPLAVLIEDASSGTSLIQHLRAAGVGGVIEVSAAGDKVRTRVDGLAIAAQAGDLCLPLIGWADATVDEWVSYGPGAAHDDRTVAASIAVDRICGMKEPRRVTFISREGAF